MKKRGGSAEPNKHSFYPQAEWPVDSRWPLPLQLPVDSAARPDLEKRSAHGSSQSPVLIMLSMVPDGMGLRL